jgi:lipopolysaccharide biosynthesis glycosyltransferase
LQIACSTNDRFAPDCAVMLASLVATNAAELVHVHLLHDESLSAASLDALRRVVVGSGARFDARAVAVDPHRRWPGSERFPVNAWYRVRLPELLPGVERVLYIDADALITARIDELWSADLDGALVGAITNPLYEKMIPRIQSELGLPDGTSYFNSGVLLIDLDAWRTAGITDAICLFVAGHAIVWPDQDALNGVLHGRRLRLHPRWNAMPGLWELPTRYLPYTSDEIREAKASPAIVHFVGPYKPWHFRSRHPFRAEWFQYVERTPWRGRPVEGRSVWQAMLRPLPTVWGYNIEVTVARWREHFYWFRQTLRTKLTEGR